MSHIIETLLDSEGWGEPQKYLFVVLNLCRMLCPLPRNPPPPPPPPNLQRDSNARIKRFWVHFELQSLTNKLVSKLYLLHCRYPVGRHLQLS